MKRKLLNAALFGAVLVAAPVSTFVSCADYDSDITALDQEITKLSDLVNQKETALKTAIAALEAQDKVLADQNAACQNKCAAEFAAVRVELQNAIKELKDALAAAEKKHGEDVASLMAADNELNKGLEKAKSDLAALDVRLTNVEDGLDATQTDVMNLIEGLKGLQGDVKKVAEDLGNLKTYVDEEIAKVVKTVNDTKAELEGKIAENAQKIVDLSKEVADNKTAFDNYKTTVDAELVALKAKDAELGGKVEDLIGRVEDLEAGMVIALSDIKDLKEWCHDLETQIIALDDQVAKNTKAITNLSVRMIDAEVAIAEANANLALLNADYEAYKVAQAAVDVAQDAALASAVASLTAAEGEYDFTNINKAYKSALELAYAAAQLAEDNAKAYADANFYNKAKVDELLEALVANHDQEFFVWQEQVLLPALGGLDERIATLEEGLSITQADVMTLTEGLHELKIEVGLEVARIEEAYKAADAKRDADFQMWIEQVLNPAFQDVYDYVNNLGVDLSKEVKGFVLEPASYYEGIQAIEGTSYEYTQWDVTDPIAPVQNGDYVKYCPAVTAHYHINPSSAVLSTVASNYSYAVLDRTNRGVNADLQPVVSKVAQNGGMLDVTIKLNAEANKTPVEHTHGEVTVMALQYTNPAAKAENQVVTSDYAVLYLNPLKEVSLVNAGNADHDITDQYAEVVTNGDQDIVSYNATYNFAEHVIAKFGDEDAVTTLPEGFSYEYTLLEGADNDYFAYTADGVVTPQLPGGKTATTACIGKSATWRIDVKHGDDVVEVGFYKLTIVGEAVVETADAAVVTEEYVVDCEGAAVPALSTSVKLDNVWNKVAEVTGESLADVKKKYSVKLDPTALVRNLVPVQFIEYVSADGRTLYKEYEGLGNMIVSADGSVLTWNIEYGDPYLAPFAAVSKERKSVKTFIQVRSNDAISKDTYNEFYLPIVWAPNPMEDWGGVQPIHWAYDRVANQWQDNKGTRQEFELRLYADLTKTEIPFEYNIPAKAMSNYKWDNKNLTFTGTADKFKNKKNFMPTNGHFVFVEHPDEMARQMKIGNDTYNFTVSEDGSEFLAALGTAEPTVIATITKEGVVRLLNKKITQKLLNAYEKDELLYGQTLCVRVGYAATSCAGKVEADNDFDVRFIKPLTVIAEDLDVADGDDTTIPGYMTTNILNSIVAWNGKTLAENVNYMKAFGVTVDLGTISKWKTNYNAAADNFKKTLGDNKIADLFSFPKDAENNVIPGAITVKNNTAVLNEFIVIVPVKVKYIWNSEPVAVEIKLHVGRTLDNSNRR